MKKYRFETNNYQLLFWILSYFVVGTILAHFSGDGFDWKLWVKILLYGIMPILFVLAWGKRIED